MNLEDEFCDILKKARFGQAQSLKALADLTHLEASDLESLEKSQRLPTKTEIHHICQALHLRLHSLVAITLDGWTPQPQPEWTTADDLVETIRGNIGGYEVKGYLLTDPDTKQTLMIDTGYNAQQMLATIKERELTLRRR